MGPNLYKNLGADATATVKAGSGTLHSISCYNGNAGVRYIQIHNVAAALSGNEVPFLTFGMPTATQLIIGPDFFGIHGLQLSTGITFGLSTTRGTYVAATASDHAVQICYT